MADESIQPSDELAAAMCEAADYAASYLKTDPVYGRRDGNPPAAQWPSEPCRIIFLDFDGVLNSDESIARLGNMFEFDRAAVALVNELIVKTSAYIVISSTWRGHFLFGENVSFLQRDGLLRSRVLGQTPQLDRQARGLEIDHWLRRAPYPVRSFVILDDNKDMVMHCGRLVQTNPKTGLQPADAARALKLLLTDWTLRTGRMGAG